MRSQRCAVVALLTLVAVGSLGDTLHSPSLQLSAASSDAPQRTAMAGRVVLTDPHTGAHWAERDL
ncbi:hypothetical protein ACQ86B_09325 [Mycolicibacterium aichiense]|uniref:hypothetical protein n=1 Tax=Mycolicibacterium aichiense TaxID=1799 RepID=UPI003D66CCAD